MIPSRHLHAVQTQLDNFYNQQHIDFAYIKVNKRPRGPCLLISNADTPYFSDGTFNQLPTNIQTNKQICEWIVETCPFMIRDVKQTSELCSLAVSKDPRSFRFIENQFKSIQLVENTLKHAISIAQNLICHENNCKCSLTYDTLGLWNFIDFIHEKNDTIISLITQFNNLIRNGKRIIKSGNFINNSRAHSI